MEEPLALRRTWTFGRLRPILVSPTVVRLRHEGVRCPIPLARGKGHQDFKQVLMDSADEVYVVAPLGKIFVKPRRVEHVNEALGLSDLNHDKSKKPYGEVNVTSDEQADKIRLVSTERRHDRVLTEMYHRLRTTLEVEPELSNDTFTTAESPQHVFVQFDGLPDNWVQEITIEFPHRPHDRHLREGHFFVPQQPPPSRQGR